MAAAVNLDAKEAADGSPTVHLVPCGSVRLRYVDRNGKPLANFRTHVRLVLPLGPSEGEKGLLPADDIDNYIDLAHPFHNTSPRSDTEGYLSFAALVPGVTYQIMWYDFKKEFTVKPGLHLELPAITINDPN
jgi:hypothetical protein